MDIWQILSIVDVSRLENPINTNNVIITLDGGEQKNTLGELRICSGRTRGKLVSLNEYLNYYSQVDNGIMLVISTADDLNFIPIQKISSIKFNRFVDEDKNYSGLEI